MELMHLVLCEIAGMCEMCDDYTQWRLPEEDVHICSNECYVEADKLGIIAVATKRAQAIKTGL